MVEGTGLPPEDSSRDVKLTGQHLQSVHAEQVNLNQSNARTVTGQRVTINGGAARSVDAVETVVDRGGVLVVRGQTTAVEKSGAGFVVADTANLNEDSFAAGVVANRVNANRSKILVLLARTVEGEVQPTFDARGAFTFGAALGAVIGFAIIVRNLISNQSAT